MHTLILKIPLQLIPAIALRAAGCRRTANRLFTHGRFIFMGCVCKLIECIPALCHPDYNMNLEFFALLLLPAGASVLPWWLYLHGQRVQAAG
jgi:hypothetical protein